MDKDNKGSSKQRVEKDQLKKHDIFNSKSKYAERMENDLEEQKYIKEMQAMEDKLDKKNNITIVCVIGVAIAIVVGLIVKVTKTPVKDFASSNKTTVEKSVNKDNNKQEKDSVDKKVKEDKKDVKDKDNKIYTYAISKENINKAVDESIKINENNKSGITAIFVSELLRKSGVNVGKDVKNTKDLVEDLTNKGWNKYTDPKGLKKGDICFTTEMSDMEGHPSHVYIFMGWVKEGKTDYGYICDSLIEENGDAIHKRNIDFETEDKQKMDFYMRKE